MIVDEIILERPKSKLSLLDLPSGYIDNEVIVDYCSSALLALGLISQTDEHKVRFSQFPHV